MEIRKLTEPDMPAALALIWETFLTFEAPDYTPEGVQSFRGFLDDRDFIASLNFIGAYETDQLLGILATRNNGRHIAMFFVRQSHHKQGIGKQLFETIRLKCADTITVNSSPFAVPVYTKLGFHATDTEQITDGIRYLPMIFVRQM